MNIAYAAEVSQSNLTVNLNAWHAILSASLVVQLTLIALVAMSVVSWAIIFAKSRKFNSVTRENNRFFDEFLKSDSLDDLFKKADEFPASGTARTFKAGYVELQRMAEAVADPTNDSGKMPKLSGSDNIQRTLNRAIDSEVSELESRLSFLATTGSTAPFIGLFGTVWGIMGSFQQIGAMKNASLAVVAPGISEALIATAIGLATAIPAVIAYNHFINKLKREEITLGNFSADYLNIIKRNFFKDS